MTRAAKIAAIIVLAFMMAGCGLSKEQIGETVKSSMQEKFNSDPQFKKWRLTVTDVQVLSKGGNQYQGIAKITHEGTSHDVPVEITVDGNNVMWQVAPGGFAFIFQKEMEKLQNIFQ